MSQPEIPALTPIISLSLNQSIPLLLDTIALEEIALAHLLNAEAEKIQFTIGTLTPTFVSLSPSVVTISNLLAINTGIRRTIGDVIKKEMLLEFKFENVLDLIQGGGLCLCPLSQGFWRTHPELWPVTSLTLGTITYTQAELLAIFSLPVAGNALVILDIQLIAAKLNVANGACPTADVVQAIAQADVLVDGLNPLPPASDTVAPGSALGQQMIAVAAVLEAFNTSCE